MGGTDEGSHDALQVDLHRTLAEAFGQSLDGFEDEALVRIAHTVAVDDGGPEAFGDPQRLDGIRAGETDHFEGCTLAERDDAGRRAGGC